MRREKRFVVMAYLPQERRWVNIFSDERTFRFEITAERNAAELMSHIEMARMKIKAVWRKKK
jgi:hypothetical protein